MKYKAILFIGKSGCGKGTQTALLQEKNNYDSFSSGQRFREIAASDTSLGMRVKDVIDSGMFMPHWFATYVFQDKVFNTSSRVGIIFDGVARKEPEAQLFHDVMSWVKRPYLVIYLKVSEGSVRGRLGIRKETEGRADDNEEGITNRLNQFNGETRKSIEFFKKKGNLLEIDGEGTPEEIHQVILNALEE